MKPLLCALLVLVACGPAPPDPPAPQSDTAVAALAEMIALRERAMIDKDVETVMSQFSDDATWINSQGYYFEGKDNVREFHAMLAGNGTRDYHYEAGEPRVRLVDSSTAIAYYSWKMRWFEKSDPGTIVHDEVGLMTLTARKQEGRWRWVAVTNQHTPWFYETIDPVTVDEE